MHKIIVGTVFVILFSTCDMSKKPIIVKQDRSGKMVLYQVFTRLYGNTNSTNKPWGTRDENGVGKFNQINDRALQSMVDLGITHVWYTGVIAHATMTDYSAFGIKPDDADVIKGRAGSPYAIKDYYDVNPDLAENVPQRMQEFENLIARSHQAGLKVIIDLVPNHVARSYSGNSKPVGIKDLGEQDDVHVPFSPNNNFYYFPNQSFVLPQSIAPKLDVQNGQYVEFPAKVTGNDVFHAQPSVHDWYETVKLNYGVDYLNGRKEYFDPIPDTWLKMAAIVNYWASKGVDGMRCDMAEMVPVQFWQYLTQTIRSTYPEFIFIAEIYNPAAYNQYLEVGGFDFLYDKVQLYDTLRHIVEGKGNTDYISTVWQQQGDITPKLIRFLENHDEQRIASPFFAGNPWKAIPAMVLTTAMHNAAVMVYFGQEIGEPGAGFSGFSADDGRTTIFDYWGVPQWQKFLNNGKYDGGLLSDDQRKLRQSYLDILSLTRYPAIAEGGFYDLHYANRNDSVQNYSNQIYAFIRHTAQQKCLVVVNFGDKATFSIHVPDHAFQHCSLQGDRWYSEKSNQDIRFESNTLNLTLDRWDWEVYFLVE